MSTGRAWRLGWKQPRAPRLACRRIRAGGRRCQLHPFIPASKAGYAIAEQYIRALDELYERLANYPKSGASRPELGPAARICLVAPYAVIYDTNSDTVTILRVLHGHRDITRALLQPPLAPEG